MPSRLVGFFPVPICGGSLSTPDVQGARWIAASRLASRLLARSALFMGLSELVADMVSRGEGSELYRITLAPLRLRHD